MPAPWGPWNLQFNGGGLRTDMASFTYGNTVTLSGGTSTIAGVNPIQFNGTMSMTTTSTLTVSDQGDFTIGVGGGGTIPLTLTTGLLTIIDNANANTTINSIVNGAGGIALGATSGFAVGQLTLNNTNTYTGSTTVNTGVLMVAASAALSTARCSNRGTADSWRSPTTVARSRSPTQSRSTHPPLRAARGRGLAASGREWWFRVPHRRH